MEFVFLLVVVFSACLLGRIWQYGTPKENLGKFLTFVFTECPNVVMWTTFVGSVGSFLSLSLLFVN